MLISETRRRFEAEYLPGERLGGGAGARGLETMGLARWMRSVGLDLCSTFPVGFAVSPLP